MTSPKKRGEGTSCHHCKKRIRPNEMLKCTRGEIVPTNSRKRKRPCVKKYCLHCIKTFYSNQYLDDNSSGSFICPACRDECRCAACRRRVMKARLKNDSNTLPNEADNVSNSILESQTPDATNIEEGQVNGLLEILDSRPDVQDIIRRGMAMDFADDNAKILYVGHLIDQALTRPDVLALYYASSHGKANNCRIKTELPPITTNNNNSIIEIDNNEASIDISNNNNNNKRKKRNHHKDKHNSESVSPDRNDRKKRKHKKHKHGNNNVIRSQLQSAIVKTEPLIVNNNTLNGMGISAPQPATISLSGGNPMNFVNNVSFPPPITNINGIHNHTTHIHTHGIQPHLSGVNGINIHTHQHQHQHGINTHGPPPNLPHINIPFPIQNNRNNHNNNINGNRVNIHKIPSIPLNIANMNNNMNNNMNHNNNQRHDSVNGNGVPPPPSYANGDNNSNGSQGNNNTNNNNNGNNMFPMNVTPSVMMGGPTLASM